MSKIWTKDEISELPDLARQHSIGEVARILNRTAFSVFHKAQLLGISFSNPNSATAIGRKAEEIGCTLLKGAFWVSKHNAHAPYDLEWDGKKINVKSSVIQYKEPGKYPRWSFKTIGTENFCDLFLLLGFINNKDPLPHRAWLVPASIVPYQHIRIGLNYKNGKYSKFEIEVNLECGLHKLPTSIGG